MKSLQSKFLNNFLAVTGPIPGIIPDAKYLSIPNLVSGMISSQLSTF